MKIEILDSVECEVSRADAGVIAPCITFETVFWVQGPFKKQRKVGTKNVFTFRGKDVWRFHTGLLPRITKYCKDQGIPVEIVGEEIKIKRQNPPFLKNITFRPDQLKLMNAACTAGRGIISSATGTGKTLMQLGILSCYPNCKALVLAHTIAIVEQTFKELQKFGFKSIEMFGGGNKAQKPTKQITVSTMQSFIAIDPEDYIDYYDCTIIDEAHHLQAKDSTYATILGNMLAPIRLGFTATTRTTDEAVLVNEGLLGPLIEEVTIQEAADLGILSTPKLRLIKSKCSQGIMDLRKYQDVYSFGIVNNQLRNRQIAEIVKEFYKQNKITLIFVTHIEHGNLIAEEIKNLFGYKVPFIQGSMSMEDREDIKAGLISKKVKICLATTSWREGVDIPNLSAVVLTGGGKSEIQVLQGIGRGLRRTKDKDEVIIVDFLDLNHTHLIRQTGERLSIYSSHGWLG